MRAALFDIDGTLTTDDFQLAADFLTPEGARAYDGAVEVVEYHREQGRQPLYLTGRPYFLDDTTRTWLEAQGFPAGPLTLAPAVDVALDGVQAYKHDVLVDWQERVQTNIEVAYGNASTDVCAYAAAGLAPGHTYIIGPNAGTACPGFEPTQPVTSYPEHLDALGE
jgi:phosphatidate phosphatase PAH1